MSFLNHYQHLQRLAPFMVAVRIAEGFEALFWPVIALRAA